MRLILINILYILPLVLAALTLSSSAALAKDTSIAAEEVFLEVFINEQPKGVTFLLRSNDSMFVGPKDLRNWRLRLPDTTPLTLYSEDFYALDALPGLTYKFDENSQALMVQAPSDLFDTTLLKGSVNNFSAPTLSSRGGFLNYRASANHSQDQTMIDGMLELGRFGAGGMGQTSILAKDLVGQSSAIRLDTSWTRDEPMQMSSLRFGDAISGTSSWGGTVRFGGVQWATNFSTQPGFVTFQQRGMSGDVTLPSTIEFYLNNKLRMKRQVPIGPFSIEDLPVTIGQGNARLVLRDMLGRERVIADTYYTSPLLLKQGLQDYSYELGFQRRNFGTNSNNYGDPMAVGTHRKGITEHFTGEIRGELLSDQQTVGIGGALLSPVASVFSGALAMSHSGKGLGGLLELGFNGESGNYSFGAKTRLASRRFTKVGLQTEEFAPQEVSQLFVNLLTTNYGSFSARYVQRSFYDGNLSKTVNANYNWKVGSKGNMSMHVKRSLSENTKTAFSLNFFMTLGNRINTSITTSHTSGGQMASLGVSRSKPVGNGVGYSLFTGLGDSDLHQAEISMQNNVGNYALLANLSKDQTVLRSSVNGGVAFLGGNAFLSRSITDSFAVVEVPGYSDVGIYLDNQLVAHTDAKGYALLPGLRSYEKNPVRIEQSDLPLDVQIDEVELDAVPYFRSGLLLKFPVRRSSGALINVVLENGEPLPAGAQVQIIRDNDIESEAFPVGFRGEVYLTGLVASNRLSVTWKEQSCEIALPFPETTEPLPHLGTYTCTEVKP